MSANEQGTAASVALPKPYLSSPGPYVVMAQEGRDGYVVGIYGPFGTVDQASEAATRHSVDGIKATPLPLHATSLLGDW